jgi:hypothetical protein
MLTMEPSNKNGYSFKKRLSQKEILEMREEVAKNFDKIQIILKKIPNYMLLVLRYSSSLNTKTTLYIILKL